MTTALLAILGSLSTILVAVLTGLLVIEARGQTLHRARRIAHRAARLLPPEHRDRYAEEWDALLADMSDRPLSALGQALSLQVAARRLRRELTTAPVLDRTGSHSSDATPAASRSHSPAPTGRLAGATHLDAALRFLRGARVFRWLAHAIDNDLRERLPLPARALAHTGVVRSLRAVGAHSRLLTYSALIVSIASAVASVLSWLADK